LETRLIVRDENARNRRLAAAQVAGDPALKQPADDGQLFRAGLVKLAAGLLTVYHCPLPFKNAERAKGGTGARLALFNQSASATAAGHLWLDPPKKKKHTRARISFFS
jgi:hypothetical protein